MERTILTVCAGFLFFFAAQAPGLCAGSWYAGVEFGPEFLTDDPHGVDDDAIALGVYGGYRIDRQLSLEAALTTASHDIDHGGDLTISSLLFGPVLSGQVDRNLVLYGDAGIGIYPIDFEHHWYRGVYVHGHSETEAGLYLGTGLEFLARKNVRAGLDLKYHALFDEDTIDSSIITLMLRLGFDLR